MKKSAVAERILSTDLGTEAEARYLNYALSVITSRALPDIRDGLTARSSSGAKPSIRN